MEGESMAYIGKQGVKFILTAVGIIFAGCLPVLFHGLSLNLTGYFRQVASRSLFP